MDNIDLELETSHLITLLLIILYSSSILLIAIFIQPLWLKTAIICFGIYNAIKTIRLHALKIEPDSIIKLWQEPNNRWFCQNKSGKIFSGKISPCSYINNQYMILLLRGAKKSHNILIAKDSLKYKDFRRLFAHIVS